MRQFCESVPAALCNNNNAANLDAHKPKGQLVALFVKGGSALPGLVAFSCTHREPA